LSDETCLYIISEGRSQVRITYSEGASRGKQSGDFSCFSDGKPLLDDSGDDSLCKVKIHFERRRRSDGNNCWLVSGSLMLRGICSQRCRTSFSWSSDGVASLESARTAQRSPVFMRCSKAGEIFEISAWATDSPNFATGRPYPLSARVEIACTTVAELMREICRRIRRA